VFDLETLRPTIEARFTRLMSSEFAKGPPTDILTWLAAKIAEGTAADYVIGLMNQALQEWKLDAPWVAWYPIGEKQRAHRDRGPPRESGLPAYGDVSRFSDARYCTG
jgi:hypothetical protein